MNLQKYNKALYPLVLALLPQIFRALGIAPELVTQEYAALVTSALVAGAVATFASPPNKE